MLLRVCWYHSWRCEMFWVNFDFEHTYMKKHGWMLHSNTRILRKQKLPTTICFITPSNNYLNIKACSWNMWCNFRIQWKNHPKSFHEASLPIFTFFPWHRKFGKMLLVYDRMFFSTLLKYLQFGLIIDAVINVAM